MSTRSPSQFDRRLRTSRRRSVLVTRSCCEPLESRKLLAVSLVLGGAQTEDAAGQMVAYQALFTSMIPVIPVGE